MIASNYNGWQIAASVAAVAAIASLAAWLVIRRKPTAEEMERARRQFLVQSGRLVDGTLLDVYEIAGDDGGGARTYLLFSYRIAGVDYECSQEITALRSVVDPAEAPAGFPCSIRYQPGNPYNSIVVAEGWTGLRVKLPQFPAFDDPNPVDRSHLKRDTR